MIATTFDFHDAANIFPMMSDDECDSLVESIRENGLLEPIRLLEDKIIDGRNRYQACVVAQVEPRFVQAKLGERSPTEYVIDLNLNRRHLNASQRAMVAAEAKTQFAVEAKERQKRKPADSVPANLPEQKKGDARDKAAASLNVSGRSVDHASTVKVHGAPELKQAVSSGRMAVSTAAKLSALPAERQKEAIAKGGEEIKKALKEVPKAAPKKKTVGQEFIAAVKEISDRMTELLHDNGTIEEILESEEWTAAKLANNAAWLDSVCQDLCAINQEVQAYANGRA